MPKAKPVGGAPRRGRPHHPAELPDLVRGQIEEMCHELAVQVKRMRQLQDQADELRTVIRQWAGQSKADPYDLPINRGGRR